MTRSITELSFVAGGDNKNVRLWVPGRFAQYSEGTALGRRYGDELIEFMQETDNTAALGQILRAIVETGQTGAVEIGFFQRLGDYIVSAGVEGPRRRPRAPRAPQPVTPPANAPCEA